MESKDRKKSRKPSQATQKELPLKKGPTARCG
jgi:hypothetical protein